MTQHSDTSPNRGLAAALVRRITRVALTVTLTGGALASATLGAPARAAHATVAPAASAMPAAAGLGSRLIIPSIGFNKAIVEGWTADINAGKITLIGDCWPGKPRTVSLPCSTIWIAGHHTSHGAPFRNLPNVRVGSLVTLTHNGTSTTYRITSKVSVVRANPPRWIFHQDILLQCSDGSKKAYVLSGTQVSPTK